VRVDQNLAGFQCSLYPGTSPGRATKPADLDIAGQPGTDNGFRRHTDRKTVVLKSG